MTENEKNTSENLYVYNIVCACVRERASERCLTNKYEKKYSMLKRLFCCVKYTWTLLIESCNINEWMNDIVDGQTDTVVYSLASEWRRNKTHKHTSYTSELIVVGNSLKYTTINRKKKHP